MLGLFQRSQSLLVLSAAPQSAATPSNVPALPPDSPANATRCSVLIVGTLAGQQATWRTPDGKVHVFSQFNDRGRGPKTSMVFTLGHNGNPVGEVIKGNHYLKNEVDEEFSVDGETALAMIPRVKPVSSLLSLSLLDCALSQFASLPVFLSLGSMPFFVHAVFSRGCSWGGNSAVSPPIGKALLLLTGSETAGIARD